MVRISVLEKIKKPIYLGSLVVLYLSYLLIFIGIYKVEPTFIHYLTVSIHVMICLFLIFTFNPFIENVKLMPYDKEIIFGSAILLLFNMIGMTKVPNFLDIKKKVTFYLS